MVFLESSYILTLISVANVFEKFLVSYILRYIKIIFEMQIFTTYWGKQEKEMPQKWLSGILGEGTILNSLLRQKHKPQTGIFPENRTNCLSDFLQIKPHILKREKRQLWISRQKNPTCLYLIVLINLSVPFRVSHLLPV